MHDKNNEMDQWINKNSSTTLPAAIQAIEKIKMDKDDDISDVVLPTYCYSRLSTWSVPPRVLLVDDDVMVMSTLAYAGCTVDVAVDGVDALNKLKKGLGYDLVLMAMPNLVSVTHSIRQYDQWIPIISMTSNDAVATGKVYGMADCLQKPLNPSTVHKMLERYCAHLVRRKQESIIIP
ncbi:hypothetical protein K501DRAFT_287673, partial [Backusella circina FSU 941]